jgi:hypothetical protein
VKTFGFTRIREWHRFNPSGYHKNIYHKHSRVINTSSKVEHGWQNRWYNLPKALCIRGISHKVIEYEGHCRIIIQQWIGWSTTELTWVSVLNQRKKECRGIRFKKLLKSLMLNIQRNYDFQTNDQKQTLWSRMDKLKDLARQSLKVRMVENQLMSGRTSESER